MSERREARASTPAGRRVTPQDIPDGILRFRPEEWPEPGMSPQEWAAERRRQRAALGPDVALTTCDYEAFRRYGTARREWRATYAAHLPLRAFDEERRRRWPSVDGPRAEQVSE